MTLQSKEHFINFELVITEVEKRRRRMLRIKGKENERTINDVQKMSNSDEINLQSSFCFLLPSIAHFNIYFFVLLSLIAIFFCFCLFSIDSSSVDIPFIPTIVDLPVSCFSSRFLFSTYIYLYRDGEALVRWYHFQPSRTKQNDRVICLKLHTFSISASSSRNYLLL